MKKYLSIVLIAALLVLVATVSVASDGLQIATGGTPGYRGINSFGANADLDIGTEDIIDQGGTLVETLVDTPATVAIFSDDVADVDAVGTLTFGDDASDGETITIASKVYTLEDSLTDFDGNVKREAAATDTIDNLIAAINLGAGSGSAYAASMTANAAPTSAYVGAGDTMLLYAETAIATTTTVAGGWGGANAVVGTGAQSVTIYGLDDSGNLQSEDVQCRGVDLSDTAGTYSFIYAMEVATAGSGGVNDGLILCTDNPTTETYAHMVDDNGKTLMAVYMIPTGFTGYLSHNFFSFGITPPAGADVACTIFTKPTGGAYSIMHQGAVVTGGQTTYQHVFCVPPKLTAGTIIKARATTDTDDTLLNAGFCIVLIEN